RTPTRARPTAKPPARPRRCPKRDVVQDRVPGAVAESDVTEFDGTGGAVHPARAGSVVDVGRLVEYGEGPLGPCKRRLHVAYLLGHTPERAIQLAKVADDEQQAAETERPVANMEDADREGQRGGNAEHQGARKIELHLQRLHAEHFPQALLRFLDEPFALVLFSRERLDDADRPERLLYDRQGIAVEQLHVLP